MSEAKFTWAADDVEPAELDPKPDPAKLLAEARRLIEGWAASAR